MTTFAFLATTVVVYAVLQIVALRTLSGVRWRLALGVAIPAASSAIVGVFGLLFGIEIAPVFYLIFAPIGAACLAIILATHVFDNLRRR